MYVYIYKSQPYFREKCIIFIPFQNGSQITDVRFASFRSISAKIKKKKKKNTFPKEIFNEILLKLGDHEHIKIAEINFG